MPSDPDNQLYNNAVKWINENPDDTSIPEEVNKLFLKFYDLRRDKQAQLLTTLLQIKNLPDEIKQSVEYFNSLSGMDDMPVEMLKKIGDNSGAEDKRNMASALKLLPSFFKLPSLLELFLQRVAYGDQESAEKLFTDVYANDKDKKQSVLLHQGQFTDYSGRTFNCSAYEYAYWAKDTHMCRMLERYMDDATKTEMLARVTEIEKAGLSYTQHGVAYCTDHFDFTPLKQALQSYVDNYHAWFAEENGDAMKAAWMYVGLAQRDVPAHVAQEYCRPDRSFDPKPEFNEATLPRGLTFFNWTTGSNNSWFPLTTSNSGLGFDFAVVRRSDSEAARGFTPLDNGISDLEAITHLDEVRTVELTQSREHLTPPALSQSMNV